MTIEVSEFRKILDELKSTSSRNDKEGIITKVSDNQNAISFLSGEEFNDIGLGKTTVLECARNVFGNGVDGKPTVSDSLIQFDGGRSHKKLHHIRRDLEYLETVSGNDMKRYLEATFKEYEYPSVISFACLHDEAIGVTDKTIANALGIRDSLPFYDGVHEIVSDRDPLTSPEVGRAFKPMLAVPESRGRPNHPTAQEKIDGYRCLLHVSDEVKAFSRRQNDITDSLPELEEIDWPDGEFIIDCEVLAEDGSYSSTSERIGRKKENVNDDNKMEFHLFDMIVSDGEDISQKTYILRFLELMQFEGQIESDLTNIVGLTDDVEKAKDEAAENGGEGIIVKDARSTYVFGKRSSYWQKVKMDSETVDVVIAGFEEGGGKASNTLGKVNLETSDGVYVGDSGSGFTDIQRDEIWNNKEEWLGRTIEVEARGVGTQGKLRMPIFVRDRSDDGEADSYERIEEIMKDV